MVVRLIEGGSVEDAIKLAGQRLKVSLAELRRSLAGELSEKRRVTLRNALDQIRS
jgi:hypothetical protein